MILGLNLGLAIERSRGLKELFHEHSWNLMRNLGSKGWSLSRNLWSPYLCRLVPGGPPPQPDQVRESSLKFQTRSIACFTDGQGYALGSVEGRVAMVGR